ALPGDWDVEVCYQSRVGPLTWIGPSTEDAIERAAQDGKKILLSPIAFVSEHIETLVELDEEYKEYAEDKGVETYLRAPALGVAEAFISGLADLVGQALANAPGLQSHAGGRICPKDWGACRNVSAFVDIEAMEPAE
ncbi:MAG: ferrochelatase, partial [Pseudomonadota bacterium]